MLLIGVLLGLVAGLLLGGRLDALLEVKLRWRVLIFLALALRFGTEAAISYGLPLANELRLPLYATTFALLVCALWLNRSHPGLLVAAAGIASNGLAITANGGWMPVWGPALALGGFTPGDLTFSFHRLLPDTLGAEFLLRGGPFGDVLPLPFPFIGTVASVGDVFMSAGLGWFVFTGLLGRRRTERIRSTSPASQGTAGVAAADGRPPGFAERPLGSLPLATRATLLGGSWGPGTDAGGGPEQQTPWQQRVRSHAYVRLALDPRFSAFWLGQTISLFGDRLHQVALAVLVYGATGSPLATGLVFLAATLPNLFVAPLAGPFVDRWNQKHVLIASDLIRAALVVAIPFVVTANIALVYPLVFGITAVSTFFRPAKAAVVPRIVAREDLMAANSAIWTGETIADIGGYPVAGLLVAFLGPALAIAFFVDAASYVTSALLILSLSIPPVARAARGTGSAAAGRLREFLNELHEGWAFLRRNPVLFHNTLISAIAQTSVGATLALTVVYARDTLDGRIIPYPENYAAIETAIGVGNLVGGLAVGAIGARLHKGPLIVGGFIGLGLATVLLGSTGNVLLALGAALAMGVANLAYVIPTQTLFAEMTPEALMGRVVALRSSLVFGALTGAMAVAGLLAERVAPGTVIALFGAVTALAGVGAALLGSVRRS